MKATPLYRIAGGTWLAGPRVKELEGSAMNKRVFLTFSLLVVCAVAALAADEKKTSTAKTAETNMPEHKVFLASDIQWKDAPPILPSGAKVAVLDARGDGDALANRGVSGGIGHGLHFFSSSGFSFPPSS